MRRTIILSAALAIMVLGLWGTVVIYFDEARLRGLVAERVSAETGRRVEIVGSLRVSLFPRPTLRATDVVIAGPEGMDGPDLLSVETIEMNVEVLPLVRGRLSPGRVAFKGATINVHSDAAGRSTLDGLSGALAGSQAFSGRSLRLEDVRLVVSDVATRRIDTVGIDLVEFDRFSLDRTVAFRFRGNLGDPPVFDELRIDGLLNVPSSPDAPVHLRDMTLSGSLAAIGVPARVEGDLAVSRTHPMRMALSLGRMQLGDQPFELSADYRGGASPTLDVTAGGERLDLGALDPRPAGQAPAAGQWLAALLRGIDVRAQLRFDQLVTPLLALADARIDLQSQPDGLALRLAALFPGGVIEGGGLLAREAEVTLALDVGLSDVARLLNALSLPGVLAGSGEAQLAFEWSWRDGDGPRLEGAFELWDGSWLVRQDGQDARRLAFDRFSGDLQLSPGYFDLPGFELVGGEFRAAGWAGIELGTGRIAGRLEAGALMPDYELAGTVAEMLLLPVPSPVEGRSGDAGADGAEDAGAGDSDR